MKNTDFNIWTFSAGCRLQTDTGTPTDGLVMKWKEKRSGEVEGWLKSGEHAVVLWRLQRGLLELSQWGELERVDKAMTGKEP